MPPAPQARAEPAPPGLPARLLELAEELRAEGVAVGTSELLDAFSALGEVSWSQRPEVKEALAATLAKSSEDRRIFDLVFERFFFRAPEAEALEHDISEQDAELDAGGAQIDLAQLRERIAQAICEGDDAALRDLARLAIAAFGR